MDIIHINFRDDTLSCIVYACTFMCLIENYSVTLNIGSQRVLPDLIKLIDSFAFLLAVVIRISRLSGRQDR